MKAYFIIGIIVVLLVAGCSTDANVKQVEEKEPYVDTSEYTLKDETIVLKPGDLFYTGGDVESSYKIVNYHYEVQSSQPIDIRVVASQSDFNLLSDGKEFVGYPSCTGHQVLRYDRECSISSKGGLVLINENNVDATVSLKISTTRKSIKYR